MWLLGQAGAEDKVMGGRDKRSASITVAIKKFDRKSICYKQLISVLCYRGVCAVYIYIILK